MPRPRVPQERRSRVAHACEHCQSKKLKCNGSQPCDNCRRRGVECQFTSKSSTKRRRLATLPDEAKGQPQQGEHDLTFSIQQDGIPIATITTPHTSFSIPENPATYDDNLAAALEALSTHFPALEDPHRPSNEQPGKEAESSSYPDTPTMCKDGNGITSFFGESCSWSYLSTVYTLVKNVTGVEASPPDSQADPDSADSLCSELSVSHTSPLPSIETTILLVESFFNQTQGILALFSQVEFIEKVQKTYQNPLLADSTWLCTLNLVLASGLLLFPQINGESIEKLNSLGIGKRQQHCAFFTNARNFRDPLSLSDAEVGGHDMVEALLLFTMYFLIVGKRNTASIYHGITVRMSYNLGLHRIHHTTSGHDERDISSGITLWRNLYVMDRLLSALSGRPPAISDSHCSDPLISGKSFRQQGARAGVTHGPDILTVLVPAARLLGRILDKIYYERDISVKAAIDIAIDLHAWVQLLPSSFQPWNLNSLSKESLQSNAQLHIWLIHFYSVTLLTRHFLVLSIEKTNTRRNMLFNANLGSEDGTEVKKLSEACIRSAIQTMKTIKAMRDNGGASERNPFVVSWAFMATLVIVTNSFSGISGGGEGIQNLDEAIELQRESAISSSHAKEYLAILLALREALLIARIPDNSHTSRSSVIDKLVNTPQPHPSLACGGLPTGLDDIFSINAPFSPTEASRALQNTPKFEHFNFEYLHNNFINTM